MSIRSMKESKVLGYLVLTAFCVFVAPPGLLGREGPETLGSGTISGFVFSKDAKTPLGGAIVKIRNLSDAKEMVSTPSDASGLYVIRDVPEGRYVLGVTSAAGDFNLDYSVYVKAGELAKLSIALAPGVRVQESGEAPAKKKGFFRSTAGLIVIVAAVGVGLVVLLSDKEPSEIK